MMMTGAKIILKIFVFAQISTDPFSFTLSGDAVTSGSKDK